MKDVRLLYASKVPGDLDTAEIEKILEQARERNEKENVTGVLFFTTEHFVQCLEGDRVPVNSLYKDIVADARHTDVILLSYHEIDERMFARWRMAYVTPDEIAKDILEQHSMGDGFDPAMVTGPMADAMLALLAKQLEEE